MKFQIGDRVLVLHSEEEGEVVDIINPKMVLIDVRGVRFPAYTDQLDFPYFKRFTEQKAGSEPKKKKYVDDLRVKKGGEPGKIENGVWLSFLPVFEADEFGDDLVESLKIHLVNNTRTGLQFTYRLNFSGKEHFGLENQILPFQDFYLHDLPFENLNDNPACTFDFSLLKTDKNKPDHFESILKLKPRQVFTKIEEIKKKGEATFSYKLFDQYPLKKFEDPPETVGPRGTGYPIYEVSSARQRLEQAKPELDLHAEKLTSNPEQMSNLEILSLQLQTLDKYLDINTAHRLASMIVIHGVGKGKLRDEIHEALRLRKDVKFFVNQYDARYGYGATEIFFQY